MVTIFAKNRISSSAKKESDKLIIRIVLFSPHEVR